MNYFSVEFVSRYFCEKDSIPFSYKSQKICVKIINFNKFVKAIVFGGTKNFFQIKSVSCNIQNMFKFKHLRRLFVNYH